MRLLHPAAVGFLLLAHLSRAEEKWHEASSKNFVLMTNASPERAESLVLTLERFRAAMGQLVPELRRWTSSRTRLYGFRDRDSLEPFLPSSGPKESRVAGYFRRGISENVIVLDLEGGTPAFERVLFHEYVHLVLSLSERKLPFWFEEGLSEFYAGTRLGDNEAEVGVSDSRHRALLARLPLLSFEELLSAEDAGEQGPLFYAQSWALVHYILVEAPEGRERLARYLASHERGVKPLAAFREAFDSGIAEELEEYVERPRLPGIKVELSPSTVGSALTRRLSMAEVQEGWGELFLATSRRRQARVCLEEAVRLAPDLGSAWEALGLLEWEEENPERAARHFEKAIELRAASASGLTRYAEILLADHLGRVDSIPAPLAEKAASALRRALALEPSARGPAELLAFLYVVRGVRLDEAHALIETGLAISPSDPSLLFLEGQLLAKRGDYQKARETLLRVVETATDPALRQEAGQFLVRMAEVERAPRK